MGLTWRSDGWVLVEQQQRWSLWTVWVWSYFILVVQLLMVILLSGSKSCSSSYNNIIMWPLDTDHNNIHTFKHGFQKFWTLLVFFKWCYLACLNSDLPSKQRKFLENLNMWRDFDNWSRSDLVGLSGRLACDMTETLDLAGDGGQ